MSRTKRVFLQPYFTQLREKKKENKPTYKVCYKTNITERFS